MPANSLFGSSLTTSSNPYGGNTYHPLQNQASNQGYQNQLGGLVSTSGYAQHTPMPPVQVLNMDMATDLIFAAVQKCMQEEIRKVIREELASVNK